MFELSPSGWSERSLLELGSYVNGYAFKPDDWSQDGLPIVRIAQITGSSDSCDHYPNILSNTYKIKNGDIIFSWSGTLAVVKWSGGPAWLNQHLFRVDHAADVAPEFLYHLLIASVAEMDKRSHGSTMKHIKRGELREYRVPVPNSLHEQKKIAQILDTLDLQIRQTEALIAKLGDIKQGLLTDLLTRGIDQDGQLRPTPDQAPNLYKDSTLGLIPKEWVAVSLDHLADNLDGKRVPIKKAVRKHGIYPYYGASGIIDWVDGYIFDGDYVLLGEDGENVISRRLPLAFRATGKIWVNNHAHVYEPKPDTDIRFLLLALEDKDYSPWILGSAQPKLTQRAISFIKFPKPPLPEQQLVADRVESLDQRIDTERRMLRKLEIEKGGLMDDLLTGRIRVTPLLEGEVQATA